jgi:hypothetical protein
MDSRLLHGLYRSSDSLSWHRILIARWRSYRTGFPVVSSVSFIESLVRDGRRGSLSLGLVVSWEWAQQDNQRERGCIAPGGRGTSWTWGCPGFPSDVFHTPTQCLLGLAEHRSPVFDSSRVNPLHLGDFACD